MLSLYHLYLKTTLAARSRLSCAFDRSTERREDNNQGYLSRIETDKADPSWSTVCKIAQVLPLDLQRVMQDTDDTDNVPAPQPTAKRQRRR